MIKIENVDVCNITRAIYSARNAMNSWNKSDSDIENDVLGSSDLSLAKRLIVAGTDHRKFMRMITIYVDVTAPLYWWKEYDTYKVGTVANSCSTMHKIAAKEFTFDDFSYEYLNGHSEMVLEDVIKALNAEREYYLKSNDKSAWWQMIQLLPSSYNQRRTLMLNYEVLTNIYKSRRGHKLDEWKTFCKWIETLPYSELITTNLKEGDKD